MMDELQAYRERAEAHDMCSEYHSIWDSCHSNRQIVDMAFGVKAVDFLCDSIAKGWGLSSEYISERFKNYINGKYVARIKGYTSKLYCQYKGDVYADSTLITLIDCDVEIVIPHPVICEIYCTGKCRISVIGGGRAKFVCYGNPENTEIEGMSEKMKRINKKHCDRNGRD